MKYLWDLENQKSVLHGNIPLNVALICCILLALLVLSHTFYTGPVESPIAHKVNLSTVLTPSPDNVFKPR